MRSNACVAKCLGAGPSGRSLPVHRVIHCLRQEGPSHCCMPLPAHNSLGGVDLFRKSSTTHPASLVPYLRAYFGGSTQQTLETHTRAHRRHHCYTRRSWLGGPTTRSLDFSRRHHVHLVRSCASLRPQPAFPPLRGHPLGRFFDGG